MANNIFQFKNSFAFTVNYQIQFTYDMTMVIEVYL